ncbi:MAG: toll/interleukin-1 receptor domain-containing protein [Lachnospiraceae bacterium]|nr:toll/interleukin-1 receptor domain-containing protein [Lachnospiraceae bacterium]
MQIFISHSSADADTAQKICELLERNDIPCFIAPRDIRSGMEYAEELINGIDRSSAILLLMSENANTSPHVLREVERAVSKSIPILVYKLEEVSLSKSMEYFLMTHQWVNAEADENYVDILRFANDIKKQNEETAEKTSGKPSVKADTAIDIGKAKAVSMPAKKKRKFLLAGGITLLTVLLAVSAIFFMIRRKATTPVFLTGDTVTFGSYNNEAIKWRILKLSDDGKQAVLISSEILTMKAFDAAESGKYNWKDSKDYWSQGSDADTDPELQAYVRGSNIWSTSNIRTWLNSSDEVVAYTDGAPFSSAMSELKNGYQNEPGFLCGFSETELSAIVETTHSTKSNILYDAASITTTDLVYLLSLEELQWFDEAGISKLAPPTQTAVEQDESNWYLLDYNDFHIHECSWWLREPVEGFSSKCYLVGNGFTKELLRQENAGLEGFGIRPALTVDLKKLASLSE